MNAETAIKDLWFVDMKKKDELTRSMTLEITHEAFDTKMSLDMGSVVNGKDVIQTDKTMDCFKKFQVVKEEDKIFGI